MACILVLFRLNVSVGGWESQERLMGLMGALGTHTGRTGHFYQINERKWVMNSDRRASFLGLSSSTNQPSLPPFTQGCIKAFSDVEICSSPMASKL